MCGTAAAHVAVPAFPSEDPMRTTPAAALLGLACAVLAAPASAQSSPTLGRNLAATCANCHGTDGRARDAMAPLAGMSADKLVGLFNDFKSGRKPATVMHQLSKGYTDDQIRAIAQYFAAQK